MDDKSYNNENDLIEGLRIGSSSAYRFFFKRYHKELCNYIMAISGDASLSEEIAQQAFVKIWEKRKQLSIEENKLTNYFFKIAYNLLIDSKRKEKKKHQLLENLKREAYLDVLIVDPDQFEQKLRQIEAEIDTLPEQCKKVFILGKKEGLKYREIAEHLHISIKTVEVHMSKALKRLRTQLSIFFL